MTEGKARSVDEYIERLSAEQAEIVSAVRSLVREASPELTEAFKWAQPVWEHAGPVCYVKAFKTYVNFGFWRGAELSGSADPTGELRGDGDKMRHRRLATLADLNREALTALVQAAVKLNLELGDPTRSRSSTG